MTSTARYDQHTSMSPRWSHRLHDGVDGEQSGKDDEGLVGTGDDWELVGPDCWWRTPFASVSWSYSPQEDQCPDNARIALPPYTPYPTLDSDSPAPMDVEDVSLNPDLVGYKLAESVLSSYERDVGFGFSVYPTIERKDFGLPLPLNLSLTEEDVVARKDQWKEAVGELLASDSEESLTSSLTGSTRRQPHSFCFPTLLTESTGSDSSSEFFAMPATPVSKASYANVLLKNMSPSCSISNDTSPVTSPRKALNAFASSFVPSSEASALSSFTFPTLNPPTSSTTRLTTVKIKKDDQGFFTDVQLGDTAHAQPQPLHAPLPSFCQDSTGARRRTRTSKTREIIDRLRSTQADNLAECISHSPSPIFHDLSFIRPRLSVSEDGGDRDWESNRSTPSLDEEEDGWINVGAEIAKSKRRRDLFSALTRRSTGSASSIQGDVEENNTAFSSPNSDGWIEGLPTNDTKPPTPPAPPPVTSNLPPKPSSTGLSAKPQRKKQLQQHTSKPSTSSSSYRSSSVSPTYPNFSLPGGRQHGQHTVPSMLNASHMTMAPPSAPVPVPVPVPYFFGHYQAMPIAVPMSSYAASLHPTTAAAYGMPAGYAVPVGVMGGIHPHRHPNTMAAVAARYASVPRG